MRFSPGIYEHAASLIGRSPWEVSRNGELLAEAHRVTWECYRHPLVVVGIDVYNVEPEAYGAEIKPPSGTGIPAISKHPCEEIEELLDLDPLNAQQGRIPEILKAGRLLKTACPGAKVRIPVCGPFALAIGLLGLDELLMGLVEDRDLLTRALQHLLTGQENFLKAIHEAGLLPIFFESGTTPPLLPVRDFTAVEAPLLKALFTKARDLFGEAPSCIIGGDATAIVQPLLETGPGFVIAPSETDQAAFLTAAAAFPEIHVRVNMSATVLASGDLPAAKEEAGRALRLAASRDNTSVGCGVVPFECDPELLCRVRDFVETSQPVPLNLHDV